MRSARSNARATSRWDTKRILPRFENRSRTGQPVSPRTGRRQEPDGDGPAGREVLARPLAAARRGRRRPDDVLEGVVGAYPAVVAGCPAAVGEPVRRQGLLPVVPEEVLVEAGRHVAPREAL